MIIRAALLPIAPVKPPSVHDEFSLLLMADTFRSGRLTNPTPADWEHFETIHVIQKPTYNSMYPPGFGAFLAAGELFHNPWLGVLLTVGLMCGAICWMLQAWLPPAWALGGTLVAAIQIGIGSYWINSYVGGAPVPAAAGALLLGAAPRFLRKPTRMTAALFALGVVFLVNTRPFEGTVLSIVCFGYVSSSLWKSRWRDLDVLWRTLAPAAVLLVAGGAFTAYYSWRVTGSPWKTAYVVNRDTYGWPENLAILPPKVITFRHSILKNMHLLELSRRLRYTTLGRMLDSWGARCDILWCFYVGPGLTLALAMSPWTARSRKIRPLLFIGAFMLSLNAFQLMCYPQHVSTETAIFYLVITIGMRHLFVLARRKGWQPERVLTSVVLSVVCAALLNLFMEPFHIRPGTFWEWPHWEFYRARAATEAKLERMPGKHLVFVRYAANHSAHEEWVYNAADLSKAKVVWANAMNLQADIILCRDFPDRYAWIVEPDIDPNGFLPFTKKIYGN